MTPPPTAIGHHATMTFTTAPDGTWTADHPWPPELLIDDELLPHLQLVNNTIFIHATNAWATYRRGASLPLVHRSRWTIIESEYTPTAPASAATTDG